MASVSLRAVRKVFGSTPVVEDVSIDIEDGEFIALLGPSGCGKTTLLRLTAGLEKPDAGEITIGGRVVAAEGVFVEPEKRKLGMVFQSYALWPTMSVAENVGFGLKVQRLPRAERKRRVMAALDTVGMAAYADRRPSALSGGQRQRTALARCLALEPRLLLLDEPLANLDAHLRQEMQSEFRRIHRETGTTLIFVTHDQNEAMALAQRIAVMDKGRLQQLGTPEELYERPKTPMVAQFLGGGVLVPATVAGAEGDRTVARIADVGVRVRGKARPGQVRLCLRADSIQMRSNPNPSGLSADVVDVVYRGGGYRHRLCLQKLPEIFLEARSEIAHAPGSTVSITITDGWIVPEAQP